MLFPKSTFLISTCDLRPLFDDEDDFKIHYFYKHPHIKRESVQNFSLRVHSSEIGSPLELVNIPCITSKINKRMF